MRIYIESWFKPKTKRSVTVIFRVIPTSTTLKKLKIAVGSDCGSAFSLWSYTSGVGPSSFWMQNNYIRPYSRFQNIHSLKLKGHSEIYMFSHGDLPSDSDWNNTFPHTLIIVYDSVPDSQHPFQRNSASCTKFQNERGWGKGRMIQNTSALGLQHHAYRPRLKQTGLLTYFFRQGLKIAIDHQRYCGL